MVLGSEGQLALQLLERVDLFLIKEAPFYTKLAVNDFHPLDNKDDGLGGF